MKLSNWFLPLFLLLLFCILVLAFAPVWVKLEQLQEENQQQRQELQDLQGQLDQEQAKPPVVIRTLRVEKVTVPELVHVGPSDLREFESQEALGRWQAERLSRRVDGWNCVDYSQAAIAQGIADGYLVFVVIEINNRYNTGHMYCGTVIGDQIIYFEPQSTTNWEGGVKGEQG